MSAPSLVGRDREVAALRDALAAARGGRGGVVLVAGEAGLGKSELAEWLGRSAAESGAAVFWGRAWESGGAPPYWPWIEVLRGLMATGLELPPGTHDVVARILPELDTGDAGGGEGGGSETERFRLFDAVARLLEAAAGRRPPLVLLMDDLHAADQPSLLLLRFVAPRLRGLPILLVGAYRDGEVRADAERDRIIVELARDARLLRLAPLDEAAAAELVEQRAGRRPSAAALRTLTETTGGNPLFLAEAAQLVAADGDVAGRPRVPARLRDVIARRAAGYSGETSATLAAAAVIGRDFALPLLAQALESDTAEVLYALDPAAAAGMVEEGPTGRMRFSHVLVREALYEQLPPSQRCELHLAVGTALERLTGDDPGERLPELAHHFLSAGAGDLADRGIDYAGRAGDRAMRLLAFEQAVASYELAVAAAESHHVPATVVCELRLKLGAAHWRAGDAVRARAAFAAAAGLARDAGEAEQLAQAALGFGEVVVEAGGVDRELIGFLEDALQMLETGQDRLRAAVTGRLARELHFAGEPERRARLAEDAVALARSLEDPAALARALGDWHVAEWGPHNVDQRLAATSEIAALAQTAGDRELVMQAHAWRFCDLIEVGDLAGADAVLETCERLAADLRQPVWAWYTLLFRGTRALVDGRFQEAERLAHEALEIGRDALGFTASVYFTVQDLARRKAQGGVEELEPVVRRLAEQQQSQWFSEHLVVLCEAGRHAEARERLEAAIATGFPDPGPDVIAVGRHAEVADVLNELGDVAGLARVTYDRLLPYADQWSGAGVGGGTHGSVERPLALLAGVLGDMAAAERHFERALEVHERVGARVWVVRTQEDFAAMLRRRNGPGDAERARELTRAAVAAARALGMTRALERLGGPAETQPTLVREGEYWALGWDGRVVRVRDSKGLQYLARLLAQPHTDIPARALVAGEGNGGSGAGAMVADGLLTVRDAADDHAGELLDEQARREYGSRADELRAELDEARSMNDPERVERLRQELDFLGAELSRAVGLGRRSRRAGSTSERARVNATRAIRTAIRRIADEHEALGAHLEGAVQTGGVCRYAPREPVAWRLNNE